MSYTPGERISFKQEQEQIRPAYEPLDVGTQFVFGKITFVNPPAMRLNVRVA